MSQEIVYRELHGFAEFEECYRLQKEVFHLADKDAIPPVFLNLLNRKFPRTGFAIGAFDKQKDSSRLIGFILSVAGTEYKSIYCLITGILPEYRKMGIGPGLFNKTKQLALANNITRLYGIYEPLEGNLGNLYLDKFGMVGIKYEKEAYELGEDIPIDKVLMKWDLDSRRTSQKLANEYLKDSFNHIIENVPIVNNDPNNQSNKVLIEIPDNFLRVKKHCKEEALIWRMQTRNLFAEYINNRQYQITEFYTNQNNSKRKNYYLLEKTTMN